MSDNIRKQIPENIDYDQTIKIMMSDTSPLKTVLLQEVSDAELTTRPVSYSMFVIKYSLLPLAYLRHPFICTVINLNIVQSPNSIAYLTDTSQMLFTVLANWRTYCVIT